MPTKQEIIAAIQQGIEQVEQTFGDLSDEDLDARIHEGDGGWTGHQILAHLAGRSGTHQMIFQMAEAPPAQPPESGSFDVNHWNQKIVDQRAGATKEQLLTEFRETHEQLVNRVEALPEEALNEQITTPRGVSSLGEVLMNSGGKHSIAHAEEMKGL
jgi:hypothetical protein